MVGPRLAAGLLKPRTGTTPSTPLAPPRDPDVVAWEVARAREILDANPGMTLLNAVCLAEAEAQQKAREGRGT